MDISQLSPQRSPWIILFAFFLYGLGHSLMASHTAKALARAWLGPLADRYYRQVFNLGGVLTLLPILALVALLPDRPLYAIPFPWTLLTTLGQALALFALAYALWQTGAAEFLGITQVFAAYNTADGATPRLVVRGLYRYVRHPLYTASMLFLWLTPTMTINLFAFYLAITAYFVVGAWFEERKLLREFAGQYRRYQARTPMFLPWGWWR